MSHQCCACLKTPKYPITLSCSHTLCYLCAKFVKENSGKCPLCKNTITEEFDKLSFADISENIVKQNHFPCVQWLFSSRDEKSWWYYDDEVSNQIEHYYQNWNEQPAQQYDSDSVTELNIPKISVGPNEYMIEFENMCQTRNMKSRKILRKAFLSQSEKDDFDRTIRGVVGIYFEKK